MLARSRAARLAVLFAILPAGSPFSPGAATPQVAGRPSRVHAPTAMTTVPAWTKSSNASPLSAMRSAYAVHMHELYTSEEVHAVLEGRQRHAPRVILFGAKYCRLCQMLLPRLRHVASQLGAGADFLRVNHCKATHAAFEDFGIQQLPTLMLCRPGQKDQFLPATPESIGWLERTLTEHSTNKWRA